MRAKSGKPLARYFPEMAEAIAKAGADDFVLDGELVVPRGDTLSFGALQDRIHPAASRVLKLSSETPALLVVFDCLAVGDATLLEEPLLRRRAALERLVRRFKRADRVRLSPYTRDRSEAEGWLERSHGALDGVVAKQVDGVYAPGKRAMLKVKQLRTADCVVGGFRYATGTQQVGSLLLGLYDGDGKLDHVGFTSAISQAERPELTRRLLAHVGGAGFSGDAPGGPSRWSTARSASWQPLRPELVVEVTYDQVTDGRFRHGTMLRRWRPDKSPAQCTREQIGEELRPGKLIAAVL